MNHQPEDRGPSIPAGAGDRPYAWLTTIGRRSGLPRTVELWFVLDGRRVYFLADGGEHADWVRNARADARVLVRLGSTEFAGLARRPPPGVDEEREARQSIAAKYQGWQEGRPLSGWAARALCLAVDLVGQDG